MELSDILLKVQKPARYIGGEQGAIIKDKSNIDVRFAFCFADSYEVGMSHLGMKILYSVANTPDWAWCERVFAPWEDMETEMRKNNIPLFALESGDKLSDFDIIGFTIPYEMCYTNILNCLDLGGIPLRSNERKDLSPIVIAGGPCTCNPEPLADFIDIFSLGEGEELTLEIMELYRKHKKLGSDKMTFLREAAKLDGVYVPAFYDAEYNDDGTIKAFHAKDGAPEKITKRIIKDLDNCHYPDNFVVPYLDIVHDRAVCEIYRGCIRGCRFCQAGYIYRPIREKTASVANAQAKQLCENTGYDELSLLSLSTSDYSQLNDLLGCMLPWTEKEKIGLQLPSLRIDNFSDELLQKVASVRKSGLTFAPEAGTQRLRDAINKNVTEKDVMDTCRVAFEGGYTSVKLYFMMGLPTETMEDIEGIATLAQKVVDLYYSLENRPKGKGVSVSVSCATFIPKPFTPFQFEPQDDFATIEAKQKHLRDCIKTRKISVSLHNSGTSLIEAVLARGDRRLCDVIYKAWEKGCKFDGWDEYFNYEKWLEAFDECGLDPAFYANRKREYDEILPWDFIDIGVSKRFLINQDKLAQESVTTPNCRQKCAGCGATKFGEGICREACKNLL
ncbi:MAG: TIGR03960 family B12-binding radical SAM protein [Clostridia bacterium]|nr:TIGR03960 family B12-binding radical SAM protein [Clostridia bacterium]